MFYNAFTVCYLFQYSKMTQMLRVIVLNVFLYRVRAEK